MDSTILFIWPALVAFTRFRGSQQSHILPGKIVRPRHEGEMSVRTERWCPTATTGAV